MGVERGLTDAELVPDLNQTIPRDSDIVRLIWDRSNSHSGDHISVLILSGSGLDLSLGIPDGSDVVHS